MKNKLPAVSEKIISSAVTLFKEQGYDNVSINAICKHAGINRSSFYNAFSNKEDIILYMFSSARQKGEVLFTDFVDAKNDFE